MTTDFQASLRKLRSLKKDLNEASDTLTAALIAVETAINELKLGVTAWIELYVEQNDPPHNIVHTFGYYKLKGKWGLVLGTYVYGMEPDGEDGITFLREASRDLRMLASGRLDDLLEILISNATKTTEEVTRLAAKTVKIASALNQGRT